MIEVQYKYVTTAEELDECMFDAVFEVREKLFSKVIHELTKDTKQGKLSISFSERETGLGSVILSVAGVLTEEVRQ